MTDRSVEDMSEEINRRGWRVNNIFQAADGSWQCNLWKPDARPGDPKTTCWAVAKTMRGAVATALADLKRDYYARAREREAAGAEPPRPAMRRRA